ncbi:hypothetical protein IWW36_002333 [Coemansia brasiliensis]|uniref:Uncharacterized protein n=1 Tax=Coemansia brasiliensis TaxID=2650707 RepID=A0A9W8LY86_9FUNG|nr:hypothetical protein IWW36_002333 [Coemansia brasiliensis]
MNIGFVILGIGAGLILIIGLFVWFNNFAGPRKSKKEKESKAAEQPSSQQSNTAPPASRAKRMTMNISGLSADGPPIPGASNNRPRNNSNRTNNSSSNGSTSNQRNQQTVIDLADIQARAEPQQPAILHNNMAVNGQQQQQQQMPYFYPPYMMNMPPTSDANGSQVNTPQMAHMPNGYPPMPYPPHPMWMGFNMPPMPGNYNMSMSMPASPTQLHSRSDTQRNQSRNEPSSSQRNESTSRANESSSSNRRRTRNRQQSVYQQPSNFLEDGRMPPELANTNRPQSNRFSTMPPPPSYNEIERDMISHG